MEFTLGVIFGVIGQIEKNPHAPKIRVKIETVNSFLTISGRDSFFIFRFQKKRMYASSFQYGYRLKGIGGFGTPNGFPLPPAT